MCFQLIFFKFFICFCIYETDCSRKYKCSSVFFFFSVWYKISMYCFILIFSFVLTFYNEIVLAIFPVPMAISAFIVVANQFCECFTRFIANDKKRRKMKINLIENVILAFCLHLKLVDLKKKNSSFRYIHLILIWYKGKMSQSIHAAY